MPAGRTTMLLISLILTSTVPLLYLPLAETTVEVKKHGVPIIDHHLISLNTTGVEESNTTTKANWEETKEMADKLPRNTYEIAVKDTLSLTDQQMREVHRVYQREEKKDAPLPGQTTYGPYYRVRGSRGVDLDPDASHLLIRTSVGERVRKVFGLPNSESRGIYTWAMKIYEKLGSPTEAEIDSLLGKLVAKVREWEKVVGQLRYVEKDVGQRRDWKVHDYRRGGDPNDQAVANLPDPPRLDVIQVYVSRLTAQQLKSVDVVYEMRQRVGSDGKKGEVYPARVKYPQSRVKADSLCILARTGLGIKEVMAAQQQQLQNQKSEGKSIYSMGILFGNETDSTTTTKKKSSANTSSREKGKIRELEDGKRSSSPAAAEVTTPKRRLVAPTEGILNEVLEKMISQVEDWKRKGSKGKLLGWSPASSPGSYAERPRGGVSSGRITPLSLAETTTPNWTPVGSAEAESASSEEEALVGKKDGGDETFSHQPDDVLYDLPDGKMSVYLHGGPAYWKRTNWRPLADALVPECTIPNVIEVFVVAGKPVESGSSMFDRIYRYPQGAENKDKSAVRTGSGEKFEKEIVPQSLELVDAEKVEKKLAENVPLRYLHLCTPLDAPLEQYTHRKLPILRWAFIIDQVVVGGQQRTAKEAKSRGDGEMKKETLIQPRPHTSYVARGPEAEIVEHLAQAMSDSIQIWKNTLNLLERKPNVYGTRHRQIIVHDYWKGVNTPVDPSMLPPAMSSTEKPNPEARVKLPESIDPTSSERVLQVFLYKQPAVEQPAALLKLADTYYPLVASCLPENCSGQLLQHRYGKAADGQRDYIPDRFYLILRMHPHVVAYELADEQMAATPPVVGEPIVVGAEATNEAATHKDLPHAERISPPSWLFTQQDMRAAIDKWVWQILQREAEEIRLSVQDDLVTRAKSYKRALEALQKLDETVEGMDPKYPEICYDEEHVKNLDKLATKAESSKPTLETVQKLDETTEEEVRYDVEHVENLVKPATREEAKKRSFETVQKLGEAVEGMDPKYPEHVENLDKLVTTAKSSKRTFETVQKLDETGAEGMDPSPLVETELSQTENEKLAGGFGWVEHVRLIPKTLDELGYNGTHEQKVAMYEKDHGHPPLGTKSLGESYMLKFFSPTCSPFGKVYKRSDVEINEQYMWNEVRVHRPLDYPRVVGLHFQFWLVDKLAMALDYAECGDFRDFLDRMHYKTKRVRKTPFPISLKQLAEYYFPAIYDALLYLHKSARVMHRDMKLENLLVYASGEVAISDFGLACLLEECKPIEDGQVEYLAPELAREEEVYDEQVDLWALGVLFYEALTNVNPMRVYEKTEGQTKKNKGRRRRRRRRNTHVNVDEDRTIEKIKNPNSKFDYSAKLWEEMPMVRKLVQALLTYDNRNGARRKAAEAAMAEFRESIHPLYEKMIHFNLIRPPIHCRAVNGGTAARSVEYLDAYLAAPAPPVG